MDKVKLYLEMARKHHFWILCALAAIVGLFAWYSASGKLLAQFNQDKATIESALQSVEKSDPTQPHADWPAGKNKESEAVSQNVLETWKGLYNNQKEKVFVWTKELGQEFLEATAQLDDPK